MSLIQTRKIGAIIIFLFLAAGCSGRAVIAGRNAQQVPYCPDCNIILISLDTLRADALGGAYKYQRDTSPNINRLADKGAVFLNTYAHAPNTFPSHMSILTALYPWNHTAETLLRDRMAPGIKTLPMQLKEGGYRTVWAAPLADRHLSLKAGFEKGFEDFIQPDWQTDSDIHTVADWLADNRGRKFFMFLHSYRIHDPYLPQPSSLQRFVTPVPSGYVSRQNFEDEVVKREGQDICPALPATLKNALPGTCPSGNRGVKPELMTGSLLRRLLFWSNFYPDSAEDIKYFRTLYDASVFEADQDIGALYTKLEELGIADKTLLAITSDHGEEFMEHGQVIHNQLYRENLHVPLIFVFPKKHINTTIARTTQSVDIAPTLLEAVGFPALPSADGSSLLPLIKGGEDGNSNPPAFGGWHGNYVVRDNRYTYLVKRNCEGKEIPACNQEEFYDRASDPGELHNIFNDNKKSAAAFSALLAEKLRSAAKKPQRAWPSDISEDTRQAISKTGYW